METSRYTLTLRREHPCWLVILVNWKDKTFNDKTLAQAAIQEYAHFFHVPTNAFFLEDSLLRFSWIFEDDKFVPHDKAKPLRSNILY